MKLEVSKRARRQIERIQAWWSENRPAAPTLVLEELMAAERLLRSNPEAGAIYAVHRTGLVRRVLLQRTSHVLYYRYRPEQEQLVVLAVWAAPRERGPKL